MNLILIGALGAVGVLSRYALDRMFQSTTFPISTFAINIVGSFLIGVVYVLGSEKGIIPENLRVAIGVGLLGGFTTFSAYSLQGILLLENKQSLVAILYLLASPILGTLAAYVGLALTRHFI